MVKYIDFVAPTVRCPGGKCLILSEEEVVLDKYGFGHNKQLVQNFGGTCFDMQ